MSLRSVALCSGLILTSAAARAEQSPATVVADGQPWHATTSKGRKIEITFFPDGRAQRTAGFLRMPM